MEICILHKLLWTATKKRLWPKIIWNSTDLLLRDTLGLGLFYSLPIYSTNKQVLEDFNCQAHIKVIWKKKKTLQNIHGPNSLHRKKEKLKVIPKLSIVGKKKKQSCLCWNWEYPFSPFIPDLFFDTFHYFSSAFQVSKHFIVNRRHKI